MNVPSERSAEHHRSFRCERWGLSGPLSVGPSL